jgi:hypothetical protein
MSSILCYFLMQEVVQYMKYSSRVWYYSQIQQYVCKYTQ